MKIRDILFKIGNEYNLAKQEPFAEHPLGIFVRQTSKDFFENTLGLEKTNILFKGSVGQSNWSDVPWMAFLDTIVTDSTLREYYVVYLFSADGNDVYLALGQGVTAVKEEFGREWKNVLHQRANVIRARLPEYKNDFSDSPFDLKGDSSLSKSYGEAPAFYKKYSISNLPEEGELHADLTKILELYSKLIFLGGTDLIETNNEEAEAFEDLTLIEKKRFRLHQKVEGRVNTSKVKKRKGYTCEACNLNFSDVYGALGDGFIEAHHLVPYAELGEGKLRKLNIDNDFAVLCANCHRMIHRMDDPSDIEGLKSKLKN